MVRRIIIELLLFAFPFILYFGGRALARLLKPGIVLPEYSKRMPFLYLAGAALAVGGFVLTWALEPKHKDQVYVPSRVENGELIPGHFVDPDKAPEIGDSYITPMQQAAQEAAKEAAERAEAAKNPPAP